MRRPFDDAARNPDILHDVAQYLEKVETPQILDLASGAGSTLHAVDSKLEVQPRWVLTDSDSTLLKIAHERHPDSQIQIIDLAQNLETLDFSTLHLVTTSAFLDLVSSDWLERLSQCLKKARVPLYAALSYNGMLRFWPEDPDDLFVTQAFNAHQKTDKGFGKAAGPEATAILIQHLKSNGFQCFAGQSDWYINKDDYRLIFSVLSGIFEAAIEIESKHEERLNQWFKSRKMALEQESLSLSVGHLDLFAIPGPLCSPN